MVDVRGRNVFLARLRRPRTAERGVVATDGRLVPRQPPAELVPLAILTLQQSSCSSTMEDVCFPMGHTASVEPCAPGSPCDVRCMLCSGVRLLASLATDEGPLPGYISKGQAVDTARSTKARRLAAPAVAFCSRTWLCAQRWLMTMSAMALTPVSCSERTKSRRSASDPYALFRLYRSVGRYLRP